ncbi:arylsulfatase [Pareuzebyella sediminis]|uniref:arylsulfatase n=1 Tax=Pareuzebyella sediminis TaxID=2607998 RepID=UPI001E5A16EA|nr:arylsulfatase [Pareuzebyella sediminis]
MTKTVIFFVIAALFLGFGLHSAHRETGINQKPKGKGFDPKPNIIIIMADDLGFSDLGCYGGEIDTPNLDRLALNGVRSNAFYNTSRCCPTRASLLTGLYPHQAGLGRMTMDAGLPGYRGSLQPNTVTLAEVLKKQGYQTGMVGKWHVSETVDLGGEKQLKWLSHQEENGPFSNLDSYPTARGFDKYYGNLWGVVDYFDPFSLVNGTEQVKDVPDDYYHTKAICDSAVAYVEQFSRKRNPFFLYVAHCAPHWPLQAPEDAVQKYMKVYQKGWKAIRRDRYERLINKGIISRETELPDFMFPNKEWNTNPDKDWDARAMAVHAAMVDLLDKSVGKLLDELESSGELDNTLILFLSDNGASAERPSKYGPGFDRAGSTRNGEMVSFPVDKEALPGPQTVVSGIGPTWAHTVNTPFRYWKARVFEGGINTPFIAFWPRGIKEKGAVRELPAHVTDIMATCIDVAGGKYPTTFKGHAITPSPGKSIMPILNGTARSGTQATFFWEHFGAKALRKANWKLVKLDGQSPWELYDLAVDKTEIHDVAMKNKELVKQLQEEWERLAHTYQVYPAPN